MFSSMFRKISVSKQSFSSAFMFLRMLRSCFITNIGYFFCFCGKYRNYAEDVDFSELCGSASPHPVRCHDHTTYICDKISKCINIMIKVKRYLGNQCLTSIHYSLTYPYFIYGCILWGNNYENPLLQHIRLQNKAIRIINDVPLQDHNYSTLC